MTTPTVKGPIFREDIREGISRFAVVFTCCGAGETPQNMNLKEASAVLKTHKCEAVDPRN